MQEGVVQFLPLSRLHLRCCVELGRVNFGFFVTANYEVVEKMLRISQSSASEQASLERSRSSWSLDFSVG